MATHRTVAPIYPIHVHYPIRVERSEGPASGAGRTKRRGISPSERAKERNLTSDTQRATLCESRARQASAVGKNGGDEMHTTLVNIATASACPVEVRLR